MIRYVFEVLNMDAYWSSFKDFCNENRAVTAVSALACVGATVFIVKRLRGPRKRVCGVDYPADIIVLHVGASKTSKLPTLGHFCMKLQTYLNINKIPYQVCYENIPGPKKKVPWIEYNGMAMGDSQLIINYLNKKFNVNLNKTLSPEQRAQAWAIQKWLEEFTYWLNVYTRWYVLLKDQLACGNVEGIPKWFTWFIPLMKGRAKKFFDTIGIGRHSDEEIFEMMKFDLRQLSVLLGDKKYLMGGDFPTEVDCAAFGQLVQVRWGAPDTCPGKQLLIGELTNLIAYIDRIKAQYWPDWDELLFKPKS